MTLKDILAKYPLRPELASIYILYKLDIIKKWGNSNNIYRGFNSKLDTTDLLGDGPLTQEDFLHVSKISVENTRKNINKDFLSASDVSLDMELAEFLFSGVFGKIEPKAKNISDHFILVTQESKSYILHIDMGSIPHLLGVPRIDVMFNDLNSKMSKYLRNVGLRTRYGRNISPGDYLANIDLMLKDADFMKDVLDFLELPATPDGLIDHKDNTDKLGYKLACIQLLSDVICMGNSIHFSGPNSLITYESSVTIDGAAENIMLVVNIPNTDGYLGLVCGYDKEKKYYYLKSLVSFNEMDILNKNNINVIKENFYLVSNGMRFNSIITDIGIKNGNKADAINFLYDILSKQPNRSTLFNNKYYYVWSSDKKDNKKQVKPKINTLFVSNLHTVESDIKVRLVRKILAILSGENRDKNSKEVLPKLFLQFCLIDRKEYEEFKAHLITIIKNYENNPDVAEILKCFYMMPQELYDEIISDDSIDREYDVEMSCGADKLKYKLHIKFPEDSSSYVYDKVYDLPTMDSYYDINTLVSLQYTNDYKIIDDCMQKAESTGTDNAIKSVFNSIFEKIKNGGITEFCEEYVLIEILNMIEYKVKLLSFFSKIIDEFSSYIFNMYNAFGEVDLNLYDQNRVLDYTEYINYAKSARLLFGLHRFVLASIFENRDRMLKEMDSMLVDLINNELDMNNQVK